MGNLCLGTNTYSCCCIWGGGGCISSAPFPPNCPMWFFVRVFLRPSTHSRTQSWPARFARDVDTVSRCFMIFLFFMSVFHVNLVRIISGLRLELSRFCWMTSLPNLQLARDGQGTEIYQMRAGMIVVILGETVQKCAKCI